MGVIWLALDERLQRKVAIKLMHQPHQEGQWRARFEAEARAIARLQHQNVVQIFDYGVNEEGAPYIVMEFLEGESLSERLQRVNSIPLDVFIPIFTQVAQGLHAAHQAGVIHRDLKPANIFLTPREHGTVAKILDFGVASVRATFDNAASELTDAKQLVGTPHYMSPEQALAEPIDFRADLWALGVVAYRSLTGRLPFNAEVLTAVLLLICSSNPAHPSLVVDGLSSSVDRFFARALAKPSAERFSDAREMAAEFAALAPEAAKKKPVSILVIDDEVDVERLFTQQFRRKIRSREYSFIFASDGSDALDKLRQHPEIDIAFTDINMPIMDGFGFLAGASAISPTLKTVVVSGYGDMRNIRKAMNAGAFDFLTKPIDFKDLKATLVKSVREVREFRAALQTIEENNALRSLVDPMVMKRLLPFMRAENSEPALAEVSVMAMRLAPWAADDNPDHSAAGGNRAAAQIDQVNRYLDAAATIVARSPGVVLRFVSRVMVAEFRGDEHFARAVQTGLHILDRLREMDTSRSASIAIEPGAVASGRIGSQSTNHLEYGLLGDSVDIALRNAYLAAPGTLVISQALASQVPESRDYTRVALPRDDVQLLNVAPSSSERETNERAKRTTPT